jgi:hypothetical protein
MSALLHNWELKLLSLGLASALWLFVMTSEKGEMTVTAPVELHSIPAGLAVAGERPESVDVQLRGFRVSLARLAPAEVRARVSLAGVRAGEVTVRIVPEQIGVPPGVTVLRVSPSRLRVLVESAAAPREGAPATGGRS